MALRNRYIDDVEAERTGWMILALFCLALLSFGFGLLVGAIFL